MLVYALRACTIPQYDSITLKSCESLASFRKNLKMSTLFWYNTILQEHRPYEITVISDLEHITSTRMHTIS